MTKTTHELVLVAIGIGLGLLFAFIIIAWNHAHCAGWLP